MHHYQVLSFICILYAIVIVPWKLPDNPSAIIMSFFLFTENRFGRQIAEPSEYPGIFGENDHRGS